MEIDPIVCHSQQEALAQILTKRCTALVVDFDLPGATEVARLAALLESSQRPAVMAMTGDWLGSGPAFQSGATRILYKPLDLLQVKDAFETANKASKRDGRNAPRYQMTSVVWLELETGTLPAVAVNLSEHGMAIRTTEHLGLRTNVSFRCTLPGMEQFHGHADIIWSDAEGHAGMFFSRLSLAAQKHLKDWLRQRAKITQGKMVQGKSDRSKSVRPGKVMPRVMAINNSIRDLLPPRMPSSR
jgi:ActR/RegA family two-component response regulator